MSIEMTNKELSSSAARAHLRMDAIEGRLFVAVAIAQRLLTTLDPEERSNLRRDIVAAVMERKGEAQLQGGAIATVEQLFGREE